MPTSTPRDTRHTPTRRSPTRRSPTRRSPSRRPPTRVRALTARHGATLRRVLAALLAALAVGGAAQLALARPEPGTSEVLVATRPITVGTPLDDAGLEPRAVPTELIPQGALTGQEQVAGRTAAAALAPGEIVLEHDLHVGQLLEDDLDGDESVAVFVPVGEPAVRAALSAGDHIDVHSPVDGSVVAEAALVIAVHHDDARGGVWLSVPPATATAVASALVADPMGTGPCVSVRPPTR